MNESSVDYSLEEVGCCLNCSKKYVGCLCYDCKCKQCYWYGTDGYRGWCDKIPILKERFMKRLKIKEEEENKYYEKIKENNNKLKNELESQGIIPNFYSCMKCGFQFVSKEELTKLWLCVKCKNG